MKKFTHGIIAVDPLDEENEMFTIIEASITNQEIYDLKKVTIVHFIGLWQKPTKEEFEEYEKEIKTNSKFGHAEIADRIVLLPAPPEILEEYYKLANEHEISKMN